MIDTLNASGLVSKTEQINCSLLGLGSMEYEPPQSWGEAYDKIAIKHRSNNLNEFEYPTLDMLYEYCQQNDGLVWYVHTKGIINGRGNYDHGDFTGDWRRLMLHYLSNHHEECILSLEKEYDAAGVNWNEGRRIFEGNFWWATCTYVRTLPLPSSLKQTRCRQGAEDWIGLVPSIKVNCLHHSHTDHYEHPYPSKIYRKDMV
jgi:hypothetical protein